MSAQTVSIADTGSLSAADARALTTRIRTQLEYLDDLLLTAWRGRVWTALDHPSWDAWVAAELGTVRLRLPVEQRRTVAATWRREGMSQRAIATGLGVSKGTVAADLAEVLVDEGMAVVVSLDGRRRPANASLPRAASAPRALSKQATALELLTAAGEAGLSVPELMKCKRWSQSQASACLSRLNRATACDGVRLVERLVQRRGAYAVYVVAAAVSERLVLEPRQRLARGAS